MAYIQQIKPEDSSGLLSKIYADCMTRVGRVWQIIQVTSINPRATRAHLDFYQSVVHKDSSLSPLVRETLAITVSKANGCDY